MALKDIVNINITRETRSVAVAAFNVPLILSTFAPITDKFEGRAKVYGDISAVLADFATTTNVYKMADAIFSQNPCVSKIVVGRVDSDDVEAGGIAYSMSKIQEENDDWYGIVADTAHESTQLAAWVETAKKMVFFWDTDADTPKESVHTDIPYLLKAANYDRSATIWHPVPSTGNDYPNGAWPGEVFPYEVGSSTWAYKTLKGVTPDKITADDEAGLKSKNCNWYSVVGGASITQQGKVASGEYIDIIIGTDWIEARLREAVYSALVNQRKLPYDDSGISAVEGLVRGVLNDAAGKGIIQRDSIQVSVPKYADISQADRIARHLPDVKFSALYLGAIHSVRIDGTLSV